MVENQIQGPYPNINNGKINPTHKTDIAQKVEEKSTRPQKEKQAY